MPPGSPPLGLVPLELDERRGADLTGTPADGLADSTLANVIAADVQARRLRDFAQQRLDKTRVLRADAEQQDRQASAELDQLRARGLQMREEVHASRREADILKLDIGELAARASSLESEFIHANSVIEGLEAELVAAQKRRVVLTSTLEAERLEATQAEQKVQAARQLRDLQRIALANAEVVVADLKQRVAQTESARQQSAARLAEAAQGNAAISFEVDRQKEGLAELARELAGVRARRASTEGEAHQERSNLERESDAVAELRQSRLHAERTLARERLGVARQQESIDAVRAISCVLQEKAVATRLEAARAEIETAATRAQADQHAHAEQDMLRERDIVRHLRSLIRMMRIERGALESEALQDRLADARARAQRDHLRAWARLQAREEADEAAARQRNAIADEQAVRTQLTAELENARADAAAVAGKLNDAVGKKAAVQAELARVERMTQALEDRRAVLLEGVSAADAAIRTTAGGLMRQRAEWQERQGLAGELRLGKARVAAEAARLEAELAVEQRSNAAAAARLAGEWRAAHDPSAQLAASEAQAEIAARDNARARSARATLDSARRDTPARRGASRWSAWPLLAGTLAFAALVIYLVPRFVPPPSVGGPSTAQTNPGAPEIAAQTPVRSTAQALPPLYGADPRAQRDLILSLELRGMPARH